MAGGVETDVSGWVCESEDDAGAETCVKGEAGGVPLGLS